MRRSFPWMGTSVFCVRQCRPNEITILVVEWCVAKILFEGREAF